MTLHEMMIEWGLSSNDKVLRAVSISELLGQNLTALQIQSYASKMVAWDRECRGSLHQALDYILEHLSKELEDSSKLGRRR